MLYIVQLFAAVCLFARDFATCMLCRDFFGLELLLAFIEIGKIARDQGTDRSHRRMVADDGRAGGDRLFVFYLVVQNIYGAI